MILTMTLRNNKDGIVLITVLILTLILCAIAIGIMSINVSQVSTGTSVVETIKAEQLATGLLYKYHQGQLDGIDVSSLSLADENLDGTNFSLDVVLPPGGTGPNDTNPINVNITYP